MRSNQYVNPYDNGYHGCHRDDHQFAPIVVGWGCDAGGKNVTKRLRMDDETAQELIEELQAVIDT